MNLLFWRKKKKQQTYVSIPAAMDEEIRRLNAQVLLYRKLTEPSFKCTKCDGVSYYRDALFVCRVICSTCGQRFDIDIETSELTESKDAIDV